jgi:predicted nuclease of predicted toxin-antitoxin system
VRLLLDESIPLRLARHLTGVDVETVHDRHWSGLKNGDLLRAAEPDYDVFVTADQNLQYQQNLKGFKIRVAVLAAHTNRLQDLLVLVPELLRVCGTLAPGEVRVIRSGSGSVET